MNPPRLYMVLLGCRPKGRLTEQHDIFFGIASSLLELLPAIKSAWPEANGILHVDAWRTVTQVGDYAVEVKEAPTGELTTDARLFFINLGGYKPGEFEEFHYKMVVAATGKSEAIQQAKQTTFYKHTGFKGATSHIDDKYGIDVDDIYEIKDILPAEFKKRYHLSLVKKQGPEDQLNLGYLMLKKITDQ